MTARCPSPRKAGWGIRASAYRCEPAGRLPAVDAPDLLRLLAVDPAGLDPAPVWSPGAGLDRLGTHLCVACDNLAVATRAVTVPGFGRRWVDRCQPHLIATAHYGRPASVDVLADLADAAHEAGADLTIVTDP